MATITRTQKRYDHRLRELVQKTQDVSCAVQQGVPRSTARGWRTASMAQVVSVDVLDMDTIQLQQEVLRLRTRIQRMIAVLRVLLVVLKISRFSLDQTRFPDGKHKRSLLRVIDRARSAIPLRSVLRIIHLSPSRYHYWNRQQPCTFDDKPSCPRLTPQQLTPAALTSNQRGLSAAAAARHVKSLAGKSLWLGLRGAELGGPGHRIEWWPLIYGRPQSIFAS